MTNLQIECFLRVAEERSFTAASWRLHMSQSSVSRQVITLERELGHQLVDRSQKKSLRLTPAGELFYRCFRRMETELASSTAAAQAFGPGGKRRLRVGVADGWRVPELISGLEKTASGFGAAVSVEAYSFRELRELLAAGGLDIIMCISSHLQLLDGMAVHPLADVPAVLYIASNNPLAGRADCLLRLPESQPLYALPEDESPLASEMETFMFMAEGVKPKIEVKPNRASIYLALCSGVGFAVFDSLHRLRYDRDMQEHRLASRIPVSAITRQSGPDPLTEAAILQMREYLLSAARE